MISVYAYARKSTLQYGDADSKSVTLQTDHACAFAETLVGEGIPDDHRYADDATSGAEVRKLVAKQRLWEAITTDPAPRRVLVMRDESRFSRRDGDEAFGELKRLASTGVEIWFYQTRSRFTFGTFADNITGYIRAETNAEYRRQVSRWTHDAFLRKARAGHVCGGRVFGYDNLRVDGHVERRVNADEAAVVSRIFALAADGFGYTRISKTLNDEGALTPKPTRGAPAGWSPSTVLAILKRPLYRGEVVYNRTRRRAPDGTTTYAKRPPAEWLSVTRPELAIVPAETWDAVRTRVETVRAHLAKTPGGSGGRRRRDSESPYLLSGFARCATCGGGIGVLDRRQYGCTAFHKKGATVCPNGVKLPIATLDGAVLDTLSRAVVHPGIIRAAVDAALAELAPPARAEGLDRQREEIAALDREIVHLTTAIATGGQLPPLLEALTARQARRELLAGALARQAAVDATRVDRADIDRRLRACLKDWRAQLAGDVPEARRLLREILAGPLTLTPDGRAYRFEGETILGDVLLRKVGLATYVVRPGGYAIGCSPLKFSGLAAAA